MNTSTNPSLPLRDAMPAAARSHRLRVPVTGWLMLALAAAMLAAPWYVPALLSNYWLKILTEILILTLFTGSANVLFGYVGLLSFGQALFFGLGAYAFVWSTTLLGLGFWPAFALSILLPTVMAALVGLVAVRLTWHYFTILTVIFSLAFFFAAVSWKSLTGGDDGLSVEAPVLGTLGGLELSLRDGTVQYLFILAVFAACTLMKYGVIRSKLGLAFVAVRENAKRAELLGYNVYVVRLHAYILAGFLAGVSGATYCMFARYASAQYMYYTTSGEAVVRMILGGAGTVFGPFVGTATMILLREELSSIWENYLIAIGVLVILITRYAPTGIVGLARAQLARLKPARREGAST